MIKKTSETIPTMASIINTKNNSTTDGYSCKFINDSEKYSTTEVKTNKTWIDGKPIYRKVIETNFTTNETEIRYTLSTIGLDNFSTIIKSYSISQGNPIEEDYYSANNDQLRTIINTSVNVLIVLVGSTYPTRPCTVYTIIEYTKTTD
jgi:uncharacterized protein YpuA (DUF1002 family)